MNNWLLVDKPAGVTSAFVVNRVKKLLKPSKIGHSGTLDPFATGLLMLAIGEATKTVDYCLNKDKDYEFTITWGENRDTLDIDGKVTASSEKIPTPEEIASVVDSFIGEIEQTPPNYSAIKINGERAYKLAREGKAIEMKSRPVTCYKLDYIQNTTGEQATFSLSCSKGFYVRSLARDICEKLGACGYVSSLRRTKIGKFKVEDAISLDISENIVHTPSVSSFNQHLLPVTAVLDDILVEQVDEATAKRLLQGQRIKTDRPNAEVLAIKHNEKLIAMAAVLNGTLSVKRVFNL
ncbi:MAG: tRNA pseudouridine(55) synthase TruB [Rickettsiales bacterium]